MAEADVQMTQVESVEMSAVTSSSSYAQSSDEVVVVEVTPAQAAEMLLTETRPATSIQSLVEETEVQMTQGQAVEASAETEPGSSKQSMVEAAQFDLTQAQLSKTGPSMFTLASLPSRMPVK